MSDLETDLKTGASLKRSEKAGEKLAKKQEISIKTAPAARAVPKQDGKLLVVLDQV